MPSPVKSLSEIRRIEDPEEFCHNLGSAIHELSRQGIQITQDQQTFWDLEWMATRLYSGGWFDLFHQIYSRDAWTRMISLLKDVGANSTAGLIEESVSLFFDAHPDYDYNLPNYGCDSDPFSWQGPKADRFHDIGEALEEIGGGVEPALMRDFALKHPDRFLENRSEQASDGQA